MADDFDIESLLEEPYKEEKKKDANLILKNSNSKEDKEDDESSKKASKKKEKKKHKSRSRSRSKDKKRKRTRSRSKKRSKSRSHSRKRSRSRNRTVRQKSPELTPEERDKRTVFCMQLAARIRPRDLEDFFTAVGKVRDVRLITDPRTKRSKGIAYIEFKSLDSVPLAIGLSGQRLLGVPIIVQPSHGEKNRIPGPVTAHPITTSVVPQTGPMKLYVGSLHVNITEEMLQGIFEPFDKIDNVNLVKDEFYRSKGYGFIQFQHADDAKRAMEQLNGFELAGRAIKVSHVTENIKDSSSISNLDSDELDRTGVNLGASGKLALMAKLAEGTGLKVPHYTLDALNMATAAANNISQQIYNQTNGGAPKY